MRRAQHDIDEVRKLGQNFRQRVEHMLNAFVRREQTKRQQHQPPLDSKFIFIKVHVGNPMWNHFNFFVGRLENFLQQLASTLGHDDHPRGKGHDLFHDPALFGGGLAQDGVERGHDRHLERPEQGHDMTAGIPSINPELMLQRNRPYVGGIQKISRSLVRSQILLLDFKAHFLWIIIAFFGISNRNDETFRLLVF